MKKILKKYLGYKGYYVLDEFESFSHELIDENELINIFSILANLGYKLSSASIILLKKVSKELYTNLINDMTNLFSEIKGVTNHLVMYKNFPNMENVTQSEYVINAILHYLTATEYSYGYMVEENLLERKLEEYAKFSELKLISQKEAKKILVNNMTTLLESNKIITDNDFEVLKEVNRLYPSSIKVSSIPFKVNLANLVNSLVYTKDGNLDKNKIPSVLEMFDPSTITITDLLRIYVAISDGDIEFIYNTQFVSLPRYSRKLFISILDNICKKNPYAIDELHSHEFLWKKAFEKLHIGEVKGLYPNAFKEAFKLRSNTYKTYNSEVEKALEEANTLKLLSLMEIKPGEFARRLDNILRSPNIDSKEVLSSFAKVASLISSRVLISLFEHFNNVTTLESDRFISYRKGSNYVNLVVEEKRKELSSEIINETINIISKALEEKYSSKEKLENVYISDEMKSYTLPTNNKNASSGFKTLSFASKVQMDNINSPVVRFFTHWKNPKGMRVDIDLSLEMFDENFNYITSLSWHNMDGGRFVKAYHSGDIVTAPNGASEFIDVNVSEAKAKGVRYMVVSNAVFAGPAYSEIDECFSGVMFRSSLGKAGSIFDAKTVETKFDLTQKSSKRIVSLAFDTFTNTLIWLDVPYKGLSFANVSSNYSNSISYILKKAMGKHMSIYDLVLLHKNHITFVDDITKADYIIDSSSKSLISPYNLELISKDWID